MESAWQVSALVWCVMLISDVIIVSWLLVWVAGECISSLVVGASQPLSSKIVAHEVAGVLDFI
jgi:hypothetical protein